MALSFPSKKKKLLIEELKHYTNLLAQHEKNKRYEYSPATSTSCRRKASQRDCNLNSKTTVHPFNSKSSYWNLNDNSLTYSRKFIRKMPSPLFSKIPHTLNKQMKFQKAKSIASSFNMLPCSKNVEKLSLQSFSKHNGNFPQEMQLKKCNNKTFKCSRESVQAKKDSKKLIGEIMAITHELKLKSQTLGSFRGQPKESSISKMKTLKVPAKKISESRDSLSNCSSHTKGKDLILCAPSNNTQVQAKHGRDCSTISTGNKTLYANVQTKLNKIGTILENSSNRINKKLSNQLTKKPNAMCNVLTNYSKESNIKNTNKLGKTFSKCNIESKKIRKQNSKFFSTSHKNNLKPCQISLLRNKLYKSSSLVKKTHQSPKSPSKLESKYKIVNKVLATERISKEKTNATICSKNVKLSNFRKRNLSSYKLTNVGIKKSTSNSKMLPNHLSLKNSHFGVEIKFGRRQKHVYNHFMNQNSGRSYLFKPELQNKPVEIHNASDVDSDLLLELAAENSINLKQTPQRHLYKSKNRIINNYSIQKRTVKMIKSKYFNPSRKSTDWRHFKGGFSKGAISVFNKQNKTTRINKRSSRFNKIVSNKFQTCKVRLQNKKIVTLKGEQFIIGSEGKSLKKLKQITKCKKKIKRASFNKSLFETIFPERSPASKIMANRVLSRSIHRMLSASEKKKTNKVNTYCMFYNRFGRCNKGVQCPYVHDPSKIAVCTRFLRGTCKNDKCPFSHEINPGKMAICSFFLQGICANIECPYRHEELSPDAKLCKDFVQGYCSKGKECKKAHVLVCPKYMQGMCEKGKQCVFPHPAAKDKKIIVKECASTEKTVDPLLETVGRYFQTNHGNIARGSVVPGRKTLPEQPSYISLSLEESS